MSSLNSLQIQATISKLNTKLARQQGLVKETEAHIEAMVQLLSQVDKTATPKK